MSSMSPEAPSKAKATRISWQSSPQGVHSKKKRLVSSGYSQLMGPPISREVEPA